MFNSLQEAIELGDGKRKNDGGVPVFELKAVEKVNRDSKEVEYEDVVWVTIFNKGDPKNIIERPMREDDKKRWPDHWKAYCENKEPPIDGVPLEDFPQITPAERLRCKQLKIRSVEELCELPDQQLDQLGGRGRALQKAAKEYVEYRKGAKVSDLQEEIDELKATIKKLQKDLDSGNSTGSNSKRGAGDKPAKAKRGNGRRSGSGGTGAAASEDSGAEAS